MTATVIEVWAPSCSACRAMRPDLEAVAAEFAGQVDLRLINVADSPQEASTLGVMATPTLIGMRGDAEAFRFSGRRSRAELRELFESLTPATAGGVPQVGRNDLVLRTGAGLALAGVGVLAGMVWPLVLAGGAITGMGLWAWLRQRQ